MLENFLQQCGLAVKKIYNRGNCLFQSILDQIEDNSGSRQEILRKRACDWMEENKSFIRGFLLLAMKLHNSTFKE